LRDLWEEVLEVRPIGIDDDFYELGGDSLRCVAMVVRIEREFGRSLPPSVLHDAGTIRLLASRLAEGPVPGEKSSLVRLRPGDGRPLFLVPSLGGSPIELYRLVTEFRRGQPIYS